MSIRYRVCGQTFQVPVYIHEQGHFATTPFSCLLLLSRPLYVLDHLTQFFPELLTVVINAVHISARPANALNDPTCLSYVLLTHLVQRKLR